MKLTLDDILKYIDDYLGDSNRVEYPLEERIRDINQINSKYLSLADFRRGGILKKNQTDSIYETITKPTGGSCVITPTRVNDIRYIEYRKTSSDF
jgi:hypothetical protein